MHLLPGCKLPCDHICGLEPEREKGQDGAAPLTVAIVSHPSPCPTNTVTDTQFVSRPWLGEGENSWKCLVGLKAPSSGHHQAKGLV